MKLTKILFVMLIIVLLSTNFVSAKKVPALVNMTLVIDAYEDPTTHVITRSAKLVYPPNSFPTGPFSMSDACTSAYSQTFPIQFITEIDADINASTWDIGENITQILNLTYYLYNYSATRESFLLSLKEANIDMSKDLAYCRNTTANAVNTGEYQLCIQQKSEYYNDKNNCEAKLKQSEDGKITNIIIGAVGAAVIMLAAKKKYYTPPADKEWPK